MAGNVQSTLEDMTRSAIGRALGSPYADTDPMIQPAARRGGQFGDYQANFAMRLAKQLGRKPRELAEQVVQHLDCAGVCDPPQVAGPGFINFTLDPAFIDQRITALAGDDRLGVPTADRPQTVVVDYSGPNVAKEMHVGHLRSTIIGDAIVRVLQLQGHDVKRQNHLGDWGTQFGRVMLGLWYEAVARDEYSNSLEGWIEQVKRVPEQSENETPEQADSRRATERLLLDEIVPWHQDRLNEDPDGFKVFVPYLHDHFPSDLEHLEKLYTFTTLITGLELAKDYTITHDVHGCNTLAELPSLFATFVQLHNKVLRHEQEGFAWTKSRDATLSACQQIYERLNVMLEPRDVMGESEYKNDLERVVQDLREAKLVKKSKDAQVVQLQGFKDREGNDLPLIVQKSDGGYLYATTDLAAARYRIDKLCADRIIYVTDARQSQHFAMLFATLRQAGWAGESIRLDHVPFGTILGKGRTPFKTREGGIVKLSDVLDEAEQRALQVVREKASVTDQQQQKRIAHAVGIGALKYADLSNDRIKDYVFDWDRMLALDGNTAPYLQNAYVRIRSIFRKGDIDPRHLTDKAVTIKEPPERVLALALFQLPQVVEAVAQHLEPHRLCTYLYDLATAFHQFYEKCPVLTADDEATRDSRLALCDLVARTLQQGLGLLGIEVVEQM